MAEPLTLVPKPTTSDEIRKEIVTLLRKTLAEAETGSLDAMFLIVKQPDGDWVERYSGLVGCSAMVGRLEIAKAVMVRDYLDQEP